MPDAPDAVLSSVMDESLREHADPFRAEKEKAYLKTDYTHYGIPVPTIHRLATTASRSLDHDALLRLVLELWDEPEPPVFERRFLAADLLANCPDLLTADDLPTVERLCRQAGTWAIIDTLAPRVVGPLADRHDVAVEAVLDEWATDPDFWIRRAALLAHLISLRDGRGDWDRFARYADPLLDDRQFFVAKAIGWVLRDTGRRRPNLVLAWVEPRIARMQAVTAREAVKPFGAEVQARLKQARAHAREQARSDQARPTRR